MDDRLKPKPIHLDIPKPEVDWSGWESPIEMSYREISRQYEEAEDRMVWNSLHEMGINIDKERLIAVIEGDKKSYADGYRKGYEDGIRDRWIPITERKPEEDGEYLFSIRSSLGDYVMEGWVRDGEYRLYDVVAWMPLPKPYEGSEEDEDD